MNTPKEHKWLSAAATPAMIKAAKDEIERCYVQNYAAEPGPAELWSVMWAAASTPPAQGDEPVAWVLKNDDGHTLIWSHQKEVIDYNRKKYPNAQFIELFARAPSDKLRGVAWHAMDALEALNERTVSAHLPAELAGKS